MIHRVVVGHLRGHAQQALLNALGIALVVMIMLILAGATFRETHQAGMLLINKILKVTFASMLWLGLLVGMVIMVINRYSQVRERTHHFAILKTLGASWTFIYTLLLEEVTLVAAAGTIGGIGLVYAIRLLLTHLVPDLLFIQTRYELWPLAGITAAISFLFADLCGLWSASAVELIEALSSEQ